MVYRSDGQSSIGPAAVFRLPRSGDALFRKKERQAYSAVKVPIVRRNDKQDALQDLVFANENVIQRLTGARFCGQVIPRHKRFCSTKFVYRGPRCLLQFLEERALGRAVEIAANQVGGLAILRRLDKGDQLLDLRPTACGGGGFSGFSRSRLLAAR